MREKQLPVNENVFNALIMGHSNAGDIESAVGILTVMTQAGLEPSADTYSTLLCGFAKSGDISEMSKFISIGESKEVFLLDKDLLEIAYALAINGHADKMNVILDRVKGSIGYNQDAINVILRLINKGQEEASMKILKTMVRHTTSDGNQADTGNFLLRQVVKINRPYQQIATICQELEYLNTNSTPQNVALETALQYGKTDIAFALMKDLKAKNVEIRHHYFWPLIVSYQTKEQITNLIEKMKNEFNLSPVSQTIREYVAPKILKMNKGDFTSTIKDLLQVGVTLATATASVAFLAINKGNLKSAAELMNSCDAYYSLPLYKSALLPALNQTQDFDSFVKILHAIHNNIHRAKTISKVEGEDDDIENTITEENTQKRSLKDLQSEIIGDMASSVVNYFKTNRLEVTHQLLQGLVDQGLSISNSKAERIQNSIGEAMTSEISILLGKLTSGELEPTEFEKTRFDFLKPKSFDKNDVDSVEKLIEKLESKGEDAKGLKKALLVAAIKSRNIPKTEEIISKLKDEGFSFSAGVYAQLIDLYAMENDVGKALENLELIKKTDAEFKLDNIKIVRVLQAYANNDRIDEGIKFLEQNKQNDASENRKEFNFQQVCWRLLNSLAEKGQTMEVNKIFDALVSNGYIVPNNVLAGALIKTHLFKNELDLALKKFEELAEKYRITPWKNEISCKLIQAEDALNLQKITDLSSDIHGEVNSLYDLVFSFLECGRIRQARKILETPGLKIRPDRINYACERYVNEGLPTALEGLMEATKDLNHIDRSEISNCLLSTYIKEDSAEKALNLWMRMQEEDVTPSDAFLSKLAGFLKEKGAKVPFAVPEIVTKVEDKSSSSETLENKEKKPKIQKGSKALKNFRLALESKDCDQIMTARSQLENDISKVSLQENSLMIEICVKNDRLDFASKIVQEMLEQKKYPKVRNFRFYLNKIAAKGDIALMETISSQIDPQLKKLLSFDNRLCHAYVVSEKSSEYLDKLEQKLDEAKTPEEIQIVGDAFPRGGIIGIMDKNPDLNEKLEKLAKKYATKGVIGPINSIWMVYFANNNPKADEIFNLHLKDHPRIMYQNILSDSRDKNDEETVRRLLKTLQNAKVSEGSLGNVHSCLIDITANKNEAQNCLKSIEYCIKDVSLENVNRTALQRAKECIEKAGLSFPYKIPEKKSKNQESSSSSSSSSSDDEVTKKKELN